MNPDPLAALDELRGLHLPMVAGAAGGEVAAAAALGLLAALAIGLLSGLLRMLRARRRAGVRRAALAELARTRGLAGPDRLVAQARLLRRLARTLAGEEAARARGPEWAARLDALFRTDSFAAGPGRALAEGLYRRGHPDPDTLDGELDRLIRRLRR